MAENLLGGAERASRLITPLLHYEIGGEEDEPDFTFIPAQYFRPERRDSYRDDWMRQGKPLPSDVDLAMESIMWGAPDGKDTREGNSASEHVEEVEMERWRAFLCNWSLPKCFVAEPGVSQLLSMTKASGRTTTRRLPYPDIWIEGEFSVDDVSFFGIRAWEVNLDENPFPSSGGNGRIQVDACFFYRQDKWPERIRYKGRDQRLPKGGTPKMFDQFAAVTDIFGDSPTEFMIEAHHGANPQQIKFIRDVLRNWLDFLESPQTRHDPVSLPRRDQDLIRRQMEGRPPSEIVRIQIVDEKLRRDVETGLKSDGFTHSFWVRGHWRTLKAERYGDNVGKRIWIAPFVKGQGVLVDKTYLVHRQ